MLSEAKKELAVKLFDIGAIKFGAFRIETAKANGLETYWYLRHLFERLPLASTEEDYRSLLPQYIDKALVNPL